MDGIVRSPLQRNNVTSDIVIGDTVISDNVHNNPLTMSDEQILEQIYSTHVHCDTVAKFDAESLFNITENILRRSTNVADNIVLQGCQGSLELDNIHPPAGFTAPLRTLKKINAEMSCKVPGEENPFETTLSILKKLSNYSWTAKGVLTLSAFAIEYGEFWLLSQHQPTESLAKSLAIFKGVPQLTKPGALRQHRNAILELNNLVKLILQAIDIIIELERLNTLHDINVPALEQFPVDVFWIIITIVTIVTKIECLTVDDSDSRQNLSPFGRKINIIINKLRNHVAQCTILIEEAENNKNLKNLFQTPTEVMDVFRVLIFRKEAPQESIYDGSTKTLVNIEVFKKKNVFMFISTLDIKQEDISILIPIYEHIKREGNHYKIVWIPIVEEWNDDLRRRFNSLKSQMPWYVLYHFVAIEGINFIRKEWHFKEKPMVVVMSPQGRILHENAYHMIHVWGVHGFPFTKPKERSITKASMWIEPLLIDIDIKINWEEEKFNIIYGGKNKDWIQQFTESAHALLNDTNIKQTQTSIELLCLESQKPNVISEFWNKVESLFETKMHDKTNIVTQHVEKLLSYKDVDGWAIVTKGSVVVYVGDGTTVLTTMKESGKWTGRVINKGFAAAFTSYASYK